MTDAECVALLQWLLPRLHMRWRGFRRVRKQVCKRFQRRITELGLEDVDAYRDYLCRRPEELLVARYLCRVTISRFNRDREVFRYLADQVFPTLAASARGADDTHLKAWSIGCASGEEPYTLAMLWKLVVAPCVPATDLRILATDIDEALLERARRACYARGALKELPTDWLPRAFETHEEGYRLRPAITRYVRLERHDLLTSVPDGPFDLVLCRNLAFTYFDTASQVRAATIIQRSLRPGGALVLGQHEQLPDKAPGFEVWSVLHRIYRRPAADHA
jgi:chemotaxis protein methyltransferase CheR